MLITVGSLYNNIPTNHFELLSVLISSHGRSPGRAIVLPPASGLAKMLKFLR